jgi:hypothetical protein
LLTFPGTISEPDPLKQAAVCRKDDPRHTGWVIKIENSSDATVK